MVGVGEGSGVGVGDSVGVTSRVAVGDTLAVDETVVVCDSTDAVIVGDDAGEDSGRALEEAVASTVAVCALDSL